MLPRSGLARVYVLRLSVCQIQQPFCTSFHALLFTPIPTPPLPPHCRSESCGNIHYTGKTGKLGVVPFYYDPEEQEVEFGDRVQFMIAKVKRTREQRAVGMKIIQRQRDIRFKVGLTDTLAECTCEF